MFAELVIHPLVLAFVEAELGESCLLSALLAINLHPGETVQPWHFDDSGAKIPRPRPALGVSTFWAIDDTTEKNGATEIIPGSHLWDGQYIEGAVNPAHFTGTADHHDGNRPDAVKLTMPSGSLAITKGTLWHRGGANRSDRPRLIITPQYCVGWVRQLENMALAVPAELASKLPERARELIGYRSIRRSWDMSMAFIRGDCCGALTDARARGLSRTLTPRRSPTRSPRVRIENDALIALLRNVGDGGDVFRRAAIIDEISRLAVFMAGDVGIVAGEP